MIELNPLQLFGITATMLALCALCLLLGFLLGYLSFRLYNKSTKITMNNLSVLNQELTEQLALVMTSNRPVPRPQEYNVLHPRDDAWEAEMERERDFEMSPESQAQLLARQEIDH